MSSAPAVPNGLAPSGSLVHQTRPADEPLELASAPHPSSDCSRNFAYWSSAKVNSNTFDIQAATTRLYQHLGFDGSVPQIKAEPTRDTLIKLVDVFDDEVSQMEQYLILCLDLKHKAHQALYAAEAEAESSRQAASHLLRNSEVTIRKTLSHFKFYADEAQDATDLYQSAYNRLVDLKYILKHFGHSIPSRPVLKI